MLTNFSGGLHQMGAGTRHWFIFLKHFLGTKLYDDMLRISENEDKCNVPFFQTKMADIMCPYKFSAVLCCPL